jgi:nitroreductase
MNIVAAAEELGYGTLPVLMASPPPENEAVIEALGVPGDLLGLSVAIGRPAPEWKPPPKKDLTQVKWVE